MIKTIGLAKHESSSSSAISSLDKEIIIKEDDDIRYNFPIILAKDPSAKIENFKNIKNIEINNEREHEIEHEDYFNFNEYDIFSLARHHKYIELESLLLKGLNPDSKDEFGNTILIIGAQNENKRIIKLSLRYGAQINIFNSMGNTALHFTTEYNYEDLSEYLIKKGANPEVKNLRGLKAIEGIRKKESEKKKFIWFKQTHNNATHPKSLSKDKMNLQKSNFAKII